MDQALEREGTALTINHSKDNEWFIGLEQQEEIIHQCSSQEEADEMGFFVENALYTDEELIEMGVDPNELGAI